MDGSMEIVRLWIGVSRVFTRRAMPLEDMV